MLNLSQYNLPNCLFQYNQQDKENVEERIKKDIIINYLPNNIELLFLSVLSKLGFQIYSNNKYTIKIFLCKNKFKIDASLITSNNLDSNKFINLESIPVKDIHNIIFYANFDFIEKNLYINEIGLANKNFFNLYTYKKSLTTDINDLEHKIYYDLIIPTIKKEYYQIIKEDYLKFIDNILTVSKPDKNEKDQLNDVMLELIEANELDLIKIFYEHNKIYNIEKALTESIQNEKALNKSIQKEKALTESIQNEKALNKSIQKEKALNESIQKEKDLNESFRKQKKEIFDLLIKYKDVTPNIIINIFTKAVACNNYEIVKSLIDNEYKLEAIDVIFSNNKDNLLNISLVNSAHNGYKETFDIVINHKYITDEFISYAFKKSLFSFLMYNISEEVLFSLIDHDKITEKDISEALQYCVSFQKHKNESFQDFTKHITKTDENIIKLLNVLINSKKIKDEAINEAFLLSISKKNDDAFNTLKDDKRLTGETINKACELSKKNEYNTACLFFKNYKNKNTTNMSNTQNPNISTNNNNHNNENQQKSKKSKSRCVIC